MRKTVHPPIESPHALKLTHGRFSVLSNLRRHQRSATCTGGGGGSGGGAGSKGPPAGGARVLRKLDEVADEDEESSEEEREDEERCDVDGAGSEESKAESAAMSTSVRRDLTVDFDN
ncbi:hypothetical protein HDU90_003922 [Geranomyces variabilis]|nr:hypothetical protein HDU90_003922 [Geranomyces variabilis]